MTVSLTINSQSFSEDGRTFIIIFSQPDELISFETFSSSFLFPPVKATLHPAPAKVFAATLPKAPVAPTTKATLPLISKEEYGLSIILTS